MVISCSSFGINGIDGYRVMVEADTTSECEKWVDSVIDVIRAEGLALDS